MGKLISHLNIVANAGIQMLAFPVFSEVVIFLNFHVKALS